MTERAKLRYNGKAYYDEDLVFIAKKELKFNGLNYLSYTLDRANNCVMAFGYFTDKEVKVPLTIPFGALDLYNVGKSNNDLVIDGKTYNYNKLMRIGQEVASLWGASCTGYSVNKKKKVVIFDCIEHGEEFVTEINFVELKNYKV